MEERIKEIYNECWKCYKQYLQDHDIAAYTERSAAMVDKYGHESDIENLVMWFVPVVNKLHSEYLREKRNGSN